jgi:hypothetical protein
MTPLDAYKLYMAIKNHFSTDSYDFFKYNGKINASQQTLDMRKDKYMFYKLSKRDDAIEYLVSNLSAEPKLWIGELFDPKCEKVFAEYRKRKESLSYIFKNDIDKLLDDFDQNFEVKDGQYPHLLKLLCGGKITKESFIIIQDCVRFFSKWNKEINDPILWPNIALNCKKLHPFMQYEKDKYSGILKDKFIP